MAERPMFSVTVLPIMPMPMAPLWVITATWPGSDITGTEGGIQGGRGRIDTEDIGSQNPHSVFAGIGYDSFFFSGIADFGETGGDDDPEFDPFFRAALDRIENIFGRNHDAGYVYIALDFLQAFVDLVAQDFSAFRIDRDISCLYIRTR